MNENFMKEKPILPLLASMAFPMVISMLVNSLYNIVDSLFVARISEDAMTALSLVFPVQNFVNAAAIGFGIGINAVIAYCLGAGDQLKADQAATHGMLFAVIHGILLTVICIAVMPGFLRMFTSDQEVLKMGVDYSNIAFLFSIMIAVSITFEKIFQSVGCMKVTMISLMCGCITNIILDPLLIFGIGPFPELGISGAALATGLGQVVTLSIYVIIYIFKPIPVQIAIKHLQRDTALDLKLYSIGIPAILNLALPSLLTSALNAILSTYSQIYVVILGIYYKLQTFLYLPANGIVQGMRPIIGFNFGAGEYERVKKIYDITLGMIAVIMALGMVICLVVPGQLMGLFTENPETIQLGKTALRFISAGFIVSSVSVASSGALEGLGKGTPSLLISLFRYTIIILPAAFVLSRFLGAVGVWNAFWIAEAVTAVIAIYIYRSAVKSR
ncbi:Multidrug export protein mepA [uncultured Roseburia sp.]|uniref:Probable multidrug resistance protein NorM n=1 Tax=Brotonthovivens ammoniilytica TaxID=2981725 RepID=A0ABT2TMZ6_9FIRM|nr:MATE family efflux transporter [Brotonthovivens ammoniilytica]MCU6763594.1 MATE family efflux transporter [Brotonthovivens ammoniilytica]SCJ26234.1 Multidrug export protein mepA [uncultured Roseburia sp.]